MFYSTHKYIDIIIAVYIFIFSYMKPILVRWIQPQSNVEFSGLF